MLSRKFGLIGTPLTHSFSKKYFEAKFLKENKPECSYDNFDIPNDDQLSFFLETNTLEGFNITIPYKKKIIQLLNELDSRAKKVGAVNCVKRINSGWKGFNTDILGFEKSLVPLITSIHQRALVLGTGGASWAVCYVFKQLGIPYQLVSTQPESGELGYSEVTDILIQQFQIIINTTPLGTFPNIDEAPTLPYHAITSTHLCYDLIYNPELTLFLSRCKEQGAQIKNGKEMLEIQAEESWKIWNREE